MLTLSMFININTSKKRSRIARNLQSVHVHLTDLQALFFSKKKPRTKKMLFFFFRLIFPHDNVCHAFRRHPVYLRVFFIFVIYLYSFFSFSSFLFHIYYFHCGNNFSSSCHTACVRDLLNK